MVAQILLSLSILVGLHEMGHLLAAKMFGMRVEQFSIGFPPKLFKFQYGETEYAFSAIPLGGYVKISGMIDESLDTEKLKEDPEPWEFRSKPAWQRLIVMLGGIVVNVITGIVIFILITYTWGDSYISKDAINDNGGIHALELAKQIGLQTGDKILKINGKEFQDSQDIINPQYLLDEKPFYTVERGGELVDITIPGNFIEYFSDENVQFFNIRTRLLVDSIQEKSLADKIGIKKGDKIIEANGTPVQFQDELAEVMNTRNMDTLSLKVDRKGSVISLINYLPKDSTKIGIYMDNSYLKKYENVQEYSLSQSIPLGTSKAFGIVFLQIKAFGKMFSGDLNVRKSLSGPIGIAEAYGRNWEWPRFWRLTGLLSMVLAFMNLLPIPALDGGHVMFLTSEIISGRKPSDKFMEMAQKVGMIILLGLMVFIFANDILKQFGI